MRFTLTWLTNITVSSVAHLHLTKVVGGLPGDRAAPSACTARENVTVADPFVEQVSSLFDKPALRAVKCLECAEICFSTLCRGEHCGT